MSTSMKATIVYRVLRKVSDWVLDEFYSEVYVDGQENVPRDGPVIIAATHHNEIIDVATLAATMPYRRPVSFWAKSTLFANPISRAILISSASIPVRRNPNRSVPVPVPADGHTRPNTDARSALFRDTSAALAAGATVGVFPEGASYTEPCIVQAKEGAGWAAVEYLWWKMEMKKEEGCDLEEAIRAAKNTRLVIVPAVVVYTDKSRFQTRVCVRYGKPISIQSFAAQLLPPPEEGVARAVVKKITSDIKNQLFELSINAMDWDSLYAARMARQILWEDDRNIPLKNFIEISQALVGMFSNTALNTSPRSWLHVRACLIRYWAYLHYTGINHSSLVTLYPKPTPSPAPSTSKSAAGLLPSVASAFLIFIIQLFTTIFHPRAIFFLPPLIVQIPAYVFSHLSVRFIATPGEEEGKAQFKAVFGGFGRGLGYAGASLGLIMWLDRIREETGSLSQNVMGMAQNTLKTYGIVDKIGRLPSGGNDVWLAGVLKWIVWLVCVTYGTASVFSRWHNALYGANHRQYKRLATSFKVLVGLISPRSSDIPTDKVELYAYPPLPPPNPFVDRPVERPVSASTSAKNVASRRLIRHLLMAKAEATSALGSYIDECGGDARRLLKEYKL